MFSPHLLACCLAALAAMTPLAHAQETTPPLAPAAPPPYRDASLPIDQRVEDLLFRLTLDEKISLIHADSKFTVAGVPRLGIPRRWLSDGPHGVREDIGPDTWKPAGRTDDFSSYMPAGIGLAATWNPELANAEGAAIGQEARARGKDIMLGPGVNILRTPLCGRNFEYMGEDPFLTSRMAVSYILGEQAQSVASCVKHFAVNNQERDRMSINAELDERALREIYLPAFRAAADAGVECFMGAYNKLRGTFCSENDALLNGILKKEWDFKGLVMSDWAATHDTREAALGGLDLEMGTDKKPYADFYLARPYKEGLDKGEFPTEGLNDKVRRNLRVLIATGGLEPEKRPAGSLNTKEHQAVARRVAEASIVLLKNENAALPLDANNLGSVAVIGENATRLQAHGGQSSEIKAFYEITPLEGIVRRAGKRVNVTYSQGYAKDVSAKDDAYIERAVAAAREAGAAIIIGGLNHDSGLDCEGSDRADLKLPYRQDELIRRVLEVNPRTIVVLLGTMAELDPAWLDKTPAVLQAWYPGMEGGTALAGVLFGDVNPSGKLPCTFPRQLEDSPAHAYGPSAYPGVNGTVEYKEGLLVGYRWYDAKNIAPLFPFGHGLSYTKFDYANLQVTDDKAADGSIGAAKFIVTNTGGRAGREVAQLYVRAPKSALFRPVQELKGFTSMNLLQGEAHNAVIPLRRNSFAYYDPAKKGWTTEPGDYEIAVGSSSRDIRLKGTFHIGGEGWFEPDVKK